MTNKNASQDQNLHPPSEPTEMIEGLIYHQRADGIVVYSFSKMTRKLVDLYARLSEYNDAYAIENNKHLRTMYVANGLFPTPYFIFKFLPSAY